MPATNDEENDELDRHLSMSEVELEKVPFHELEDSYVETLPWPEECRDEAWQRIQRVYERRRVKEGLPEKPPSNMREVFERGLKARPKMAEPREPEPMEKKSSLKKAAKDEADDEDMSLPGQGRLGEAYGRYDASPRLIDCLPLSMAEKSILKKLFAYRLPNGLARVSEVALATDISCVDRTVRRGLRRLEEMKLIERERTGRKGLGSSLYRVYLPREWPRKMIDAARKERNRRARLIESQPDK